MHNNLAIYLNTFGGKDASGHLMALYSEENRTWQPIVDLRYIILSKREGKVIIRLRFGHTIPRPKNTSKIKVGENLCIKINHDETDAWKNPNRDVFWGGAITGEVLDKENSFKSILDKIQKAEAIHADDGSMHRTKNIPISTAALIAKEIFND